MLFKTIISLILLNVNLIQKLSAICGGSHNEDKRKFHLTKDELSLTKLEAKIDAEPCADHQSVSIFILSTATTAGESYLKREAQRKTWVSEAKENNISVYFVIALSENQTTNQLLREESNQYKDMIQFQFIDNYWNQTLKTLSILHWAQNKCHKSKYIIKTDDDTIVNIDMLLNDLNLFQSGISGLKFSNAIVKRFTNEDCAWYTKENFKPDVFPEFVFGWFYAVTSDVIPKLLETLDTYSDNVLDTEDVFVTGVLAEKAGVARYNIKQLILDGCTLQHKCDVSNLMAISECKSGEDLVNLYETWKKMNISTECSNTGLI